MTSTKEADAKSETETEALLSPPKYASEDERFTPIEPRPAETAPGPDPENAAVVAAVAAVTDTPSSPAPQPSPAPEYNVPLYEETGLTGLTPEAREILGLPLQSSPNPDDPLYHDKWTIVNRFRDSVVKDNAEMVVLMLESGLISPNMTDWDGVTVLGLAAQNGHLRLAKILVESGAEPDKVFLRSQPYKRKDQEATRTPLMLAAEAGHLAIVKYLMSLGADDGFMASDGQLALRLAADNKHKDVVDFLPTRRGGTMLRWKTHHARSIKAIKSALSSIKAFITFIVWNIPKGILYDFPVWVGKETGKAIKKAYTKRKEFIPWCKRTAVAVGRGIKGAAVEIKNAAVKLPGAIKRGILGTPAAIKRFGNWVANLVTTVLKWTADTAKRVGSAIASVFGSALSAVVTALMAAWSYICRIKNVTLADVGAALMAVVRAIAKVPETLWNALHKLGDALYSALGVTLKVLWTIIYLIGYVIFFIVTYIPRKIWEILTALAGSMAKGVHEILVWFNPKW